MFKKRTLFIVDAGASREFELPLGAVLAKQIAIKMKIPSDHRWEKSQPPDIELAQQILVNHKEHRDTLAACWLIRDGVQLSNSIDDFLDVHSENKHAQRVGDLAPGGGLLQLNVCQM